MTNALTFRALAALPQDLQALAKQHVAAHPYEDINDRIGELSLALLELADAAPDATRVFARARGRIRRATQDPAHYAAGIDDAHDIERDDEPTPICRQDIVREVQQRQHVTSRRAQQIIRAQLARAAQGDLFMEGGAACI